MKRTNRNYLMIFVVSLTISLLISPLRGGYCNLFGLQGFRLSMLIYSVVYMAVTYYILNRTKNILPSYSVAIMIIIGAVILDSIVRIIDFSGTLMSLPDMIYRILSIVVALWMFKCRKYIWKGVIFITFFSLLIWSIVSGYNLWANIIEFGTPSGNVSLKIEAPLYLQSNNGEYVSIDDFKENYVVLDFFISTCGVCFEKFPLVEKLNQQFKTNPKIGVYAVHGMYVNGNESVETGGQLLSELDYTFQYLSVNIEDPVLKRLGVRVYPTVLIYDTKEKEYIFIGNIENASLKIQTLVY